MHMLEDKGLDYCSVSMWTIIIENMYKEILIIPVQPWSVQLAKAHFTGMFVLISELRCYNPFFEGVLLQ
jgi:hypothetical protein